MIDQEEVTDPANRESAAAAEEEEEEEVVAFDELNEHEKLMVLQHLYKEY